MSDRSWWSHVAQWSLWFLLMTAVMAWIGRTRLRKRTGRNADVMEYPISVLAIGLAAVAMYLTFAVLCYSDFARASSASEPEWVCLMFLSFASLGGLAIAEYYLVAHELKPDGIRYKTLLGRRGFIRWKEVRAVRYSHLGRWFRIDTQNGDFVRVSAMLMLLPEFAITILRAVPRRKIMSDTERILEETASGSPPRMF